MNQKRIAIIVSIIVILLVIFFVVRGGGDETQIKDAGEELAGALEYDEDGELEKDDVKIINEDEEEEEEEFDLTNHNFILGIKTDTVDIQAPVFDGVTKNVLDKGVGRHYTTAIPNPETGNVVLSGHQFYPGGKPGHTVFENLDELEIGDEVSIDYFGKSYTYKINDSKVVEPTEVSILEQTEKPQLTLYTCYPRYTTEKRLVYTADLISVE